MVQRLAKWPFVFDILRWILEGGYAGHKTVIEREMWGRQGAILDIGCGTGIFSRYFPEADYLGVDLSPIYIDAAIRKSSGHQFLVADARQLPLAARSFAMAMISGVLHHLSDDDTRQVLGEASRILSADGHLIVWEDIPTVSRRNFIGHWVHRFDPGQHIRRPQEYRALLNCDFQVQSERLMHSGFMDYVVFVCTPHTPRQTIGSGTKRPAAS
jgi:ubiquinone/menaquinone biosynthesis C-methylase UbiE